jgi:hypothetical protein
MSDQRQFPRRVAVLAANSARQEPKEATEAANKNPTEVILRRLEAAKDNVGIL